MYASIIDMTLLLPVDQALFDELRADFLPRAAQHPGFRGFQYVLADHGRAVGILWYDQPEDLDGITQLVGTWFQDHIVPRLAGPETAVRGRVVVNMAPPHTATACCNNAKLATWGWRQGSTEADPDAGRMLPVGVTAMAYATGRAQPEAVANDRTMATSETGRAYRHW